MTHFSRQALSALIAIPAASLLFGACSDEFDSCEAQRTCASGGSNSTGGSGSDAGHSAGGADGSASGGAAVGGDAAGGDDGHGNAGEGGTDFGEGGVGGSSGGSDGVAGAGATNSTGGGGGSSSGGAHSTGGATGLGGEGGEGGSIAGARCGDATVDTGEACDDGNQDPADGCRANCTWGPKQVVAGAHSSCAIFGNGAAKCWGGNANYQLGQGDVDDRGNGPDEMGSALPFIRVGGQVGAFSSLAIHETMGCGVVKQQVWCWGKNPYGQLGQGEAVDIDHPIPVPLDLGGAVSSVGVGSGFACGLLADGKVKCWGHGLYGTLGLGHEFDIGDEPGEMGSALKSIALGERATQVGVSADHACALLASGKVVCWGRGGSWLGQGVASETLSFGDEPTELTPPAVPLGQGGVVSSIGLGSSHACAVLGGLVKCWGGNGYGQLGLGTTASRGATLSELGTALPVVPITPTLGGDPVVSVHAGQGHTCALLGSGGVKCWGCEVPGSTLGVLYRGVLAQPSLVAALGNLGDQPDEISTMPVIDFGAGTTVRSLATGALHNCALLSTGDVKCWGNNFFGKLGLGHTMSIGTNVSQLGATMQAVALD